MSGAKMAHTAPQPHVRATCIRSQGVAQAALGTGGVREAHINADWPADFDGDGPRGTSDLDPPAARFER
jgi:hypothetical protein